MLLPLLFLMACSAQTVPDSQISPSPSALPFATATLRPTFTPRPTATIAPPTVAPTIAPIIASLTNQVNIRVAPDKNAKSMGLLNYGSRVQVIGKDASESWWLIIYPENSSTTAWVNAAFVIVNAAEAEKIPVVKIEATSTPNISGSPKEIETPTAQAQTPATPPRTAKVLTQINVRSGPGQAFSALGLINAGTLVTLVGRNQDNSWIQILFDQGANGKGWVAAAYVDGEDLKGLPYFDGQGNLISEGSLSSNPGSQTLTPTAFSPAVADGDSEINPIIRMQFSPDGAREFTFSSDVSSPTGDTTDWVAFIPYEPANQSTYVYLKLSCIGNGAVTGVLEKDGIPVTDTKPIVCGNYDVAMKVQGGKEYFLALNADGSNGPLRYAQYTLTIKSTH